MNEKDKILSDLEITTCTEILKAIDKTTDVILMACSSKYVLPKDTSIDGIKPLPTNLSCEDLKHLAQGVVILADSYSIIKKS